MRVVGCIVVFACLAAGGYGGGGGKIAGKVTLDGQPLAGATVEFTPQKKEGGRPAIGETDSNGNYELQYLIDDPNVPAGDYIVRITTLGSKEGEDGEEIEVPELVPAKYNSESTLVRTVKGSEEMNFDLKTRD